MKSCTTFGALALLLSLVCSTAAIAHDQELCKIAPENSLEIPVDAPASKRGAGIDEKTYNKLIDEVEAYYIPVVKKLGATLKINRMWSTATVNSTAHQSGKKWFVDAYGGLARYPIMTADAESAVLCHEMGHHLGGFPKVKSFGNSWASNEGQSDYYATMKCFRVLHENDDNVSLMANVTIPKEVKAGCTQAFKSTKEIALCHRSAMAGKVLAQVLYELGHNKLDLMAAGEPDVEPAFDTPSTNVVTSTNGAHPLAQCRLDTYFNGAICGMSATENFGTTEGATGACAEEKKDTYGFRPRCWYKPKL